MQHRRSDCPNGRAGQDDSENSARYVGRTGISKNHNSVVITNCSSGLGDALTVRNHYNGQKTSDASTCANRTLQWGWFTVCRYERSYRKIFSLEISENKSKNRMRRWDPTHGPPSILYATCRSSIWITLSINLERDCLRTDRRWHFISVLWMEPIAKCGWPVCEGRRLRTGDVKRMSYDFSVIQVLA